MTGRPSKYSDKTASKICEQIATTSYSLKTICKDEELPHVSTVLRWLTDNESFRDQYARAKEQQADFLAEEIIEIADDGSNDFMVITKGNESYETENKEVTGRSRLRVDARKWVASKLKPKKYGEKIDLTSAGEKLNTPPLIDYSQLTDEQLAFLESLPIRSEEGKRQA